MWLVTAPGKPDHGHPNHAGRPRKNGGKTTMSGTGWFFTIGIIYLVLLFTLAVLSFRKGHWVLGLIGFIFPVLWLIGAILPDRRRRR
jgi:hypothetical protein